MTHEALDVSASHLDAEPVFTGCRGHHDILKALTRDKASRELPLTTSHSTRTGLDHLKVLSQEPECGADLCLSHLCTQTRILDRFLELEAPFLLYQPEGLTSAVLAVPLLPVSTIVLHPNAPDHMGCTSTDLTPHTDSDSRGGGHQERLNAGLCLCTLTIDDDAALTADKRDNTRIMKWVIRPATRAYYGDF